MKKRLYLVIATLMLVSIAMGQTLHVRMGSVTYLFPADKTGEMSYADGRTLSVMGKTFDLSTISTMTVDDATVKDNAVSITFSGTTATVVISGNIAPYVTATVNGAHVSIEQTNTDAVDGDEITYTLSGETANGSFSLAGSYKCSIALDGLTLTNPSGAAISITNGKRIQISAKKNTVNTLTDGSNGTQTGCIYSKGQIQLQGNGTLNVTGNTKHAIKSGDYVRVKNLTLNITKAVKDGISCNEYFLMESGMVTISGVGDEGIQCELDGTTSTGQTTDHEDEDSGNIYIEGGTLQVTSTKGEGIESKGELTISGGNVCVNAKDDAINAASHLTITDGIVYACSTGNDGIDANGNCYIKGGTIFAIGARQPEVAIDANTERNFNLYVSGGTIIAIGGLERGSSLTQSCYQASSWSSNRWYALTVGSQTIAFKTPSSGGSGLVVSGASQPTLKQGVTVSDGTQIFGSNGYVDATVTGGSNVTLSAYSNQGGGPGGGGGGPWW